MLPEKVSNLMMMKLNSTMVNVMKEKSQIEPAYTVEDIKDIISINLEPNYDPEDPDDPGSVDYIEDIDEELRVVDVDDNEVDMICDI